MSRPSKRVIISHPSFGSIAFPRLFGNLQYCMDRDDSEAFFKESVKGTHTVRKSDTSGGYAAIVDVITDPEKKCIPIDVEVQAPCKGSFERVFNGILDVKRYDKTKCSITFDILGNSIYDCIEREKEKPYNFYTSTDVYNATTQIAGMSTPTIIVTDRNGNNPAIDQQVFPLGSDGLPNEWWEKETNAGVVTGPDGEDTTITQTVWYRDQITVNTGAVPVGSGWQLLSSSGGLDTFIRCPLIQVPRIVNGRKLKDVVEHAILSRLGVCGVCEVVSNFLGLNPIGGTPSNTAYNNSYKLNDLLIFQRTDVKKPSADRPAGSNGFTQLFEWNVESILKMLKKVFKMKWRIEEIDNEDCKYRFRIEHCSFFRNKKPCVDLRNRPYVSGCSWEQKKKGIVYVRSFEWQHGSDSEDFEGVPVFSDPFCSEGKEDCKIEDISTNVAYIINNEDVPNEGFVLVAVDGQNTITSASGALLGGDYIINTEPGAITGQSLVNGAMSWANIHAFFHLDDAPTPTGTLNGESVNFESVLSTYKAGDVERRGCCLVKPPTESCYLTKLSGQGGISDAGELVSYCYDFGERRETYKIEHSCELGQ